MVFAKHLRIIGDDFRAKYLNSTDDRDYTVYSEDWTRMKVSQRIRWRHGYMIMQVELRLWKHSAYTAVYVQHFTRTLSTIILHISYYLMGVNLRG